MQAYIAEGRLITIPFLPVALYSELCVCAANFTLDINVTSNDQPGVRAMGPDPLPVHLYFLLCHCVGLGNNGNHTHELADNRHQDQINLQQTAMP